MNRIAVALGLALLAVPAASFAQDAPPAGKPATEEPMSLDERFYRAFYQENGLRDFDRAAVLYAQVVEAAANAKNREMQVKALLGRSRCLQRMQKTDEAGKAIAEVLRIDPANAEAKGMLGGAAEPEGLEKRIETLAGWLEQGMASATIRELRLAGDRAVPILARSLRKRNLAAVESTATLLAFYATPASRAALLAALRDPEVVYSAAVAEVVCHPALSSEYRTFDDGEIPLLEEILARPEIDLRNRVLVRLRDDSSHPPSIVPLVLRLARDPVATVRVLALKSEWSAVIVRALEPAIRASLASEVPEERAAAAQAAGRDADLLRGLQAEVRALLKDSSAEPRQAAFLALAERDGLTQSDLAGLLDDPDGEIVRNAVERLRNSAPWGEVAAAAVRKAIQKALRAEIPANGIEAVVSLVAVESRPGGFTPEEQVDLLGATWTKGFPWGAVATANFRMKIFGLLESRVNAEGYLVGMDRLVLRGMDAIPSPDGVVQWIEFWNGKTGSGAREAWLRGAASADPRVRTLSYETVFVSHHHQDGLGKEVTDPLALAGPVSAVLPRISADMASEDKSLRDAAIGVACMAPDPALAKDLRALHDQASGELRARYLEVLVRAAGKDALDAVRADMASKDPAVRSEALGRLVISLGTTEPAEIQAYLASGGLPSEVAALWNRWENPPPVALLRAFLKSLPQDRIDDEVLSAARNLPAAERWWILEKALHSGSAATRQMAASHASDWRAVEAIPMLAELLDDPEEGVRTNASAALQELRNYIELKSTAARMREGGEANTFALAEGMLRDADPLKRRGAILALAALGDKSAVAILLKALDDPDKGVREAALGALERLGGTAAPAPASKKGE